MLYHREHCKMRMLIVLSLNVTLAFATMHSESDLSKFLAGKFEFESSQLCTNLAQASFAYETNLTNANQQKVVQETLKSSNYEKQIYPEWFKDVDVSTIHNDTIRMMLKYLKVQGASGLNQSDILNLTETTAKMTQIYSTAKICPYEHQHCDIKSQGWNLEPEMEQVMSSSTDYDELIYVWKNWRDASGKKMRELYKTYVELSNKAAKLDGFEDAGDNWRFYFDTPDFIKVVDGLWTQISPLYKQLHAYTSDKLKARYGERLDTSDGLLPAHIFGNMWAQHWEGLESILKPFPNETNVVNVTKALHDQGYSVQRMFDTANEFYMSLGLPSSAMSYGPKAMIVRPKDREVTCHASAWDFCNKEDFRIKMCTSVNEEDFVTIHHEMGHIMYYQLYKNQPQAFRNGANPGFHEAVGDTISLSVKSAKHLKRIGLVSANYTQTKNSEINALLSQALSKVAFMPFGLLIDKWRWDVFQGNVAESEWNAHWWHYREKYQLIKAPVARTEDDFDPGAKFHIPNNSPYISYFVSHILQFQFYKALCIAAKEYDPITKSPPLHQCDFYENKAAGKLLRDGLSLGSSKRWPEVLEIMTGTNQLDATAFVEYFAPLTEHLESIGYSSGRVSFASSPVYLFITIAISGFYIFV